jgi:hypothetical protein
MKKILALAVVAAAVAAAVPAFAGGCCSGSAGAKNGFDCQNQCPLAQDANSHRSMGRESMAVSTTVRAAVATMVQKNLARI